VSKVRVGRGSVVVEIDDGIADALLAAAEAALPGAVDVMKAELAAVVDAGRAGWPVGRDRGEPHSRDLFEVDVRIDPVDFAVEGVITNRAPYAYKILLPGGYGSPWQKLIRKPTLDAAQRIADAVAKRLTEVIDRG
jgi:hypothetical protein